MYAFAASIPDYCIPIALPTTGSSGMLLGFAALVLTIGIALVLMARRNALGAGLAIAAFAAASLIGTTGTADAQAPPECPPGYTLDPNWQQPATTTPTTTTAPIAADTPGPTTTAATTTTTTTIPGPVPDLTPVLTVTPAAFNAQGPVNFKVQVVELNGVDTFGLITVRIAKDSLWTLNGSSLDNPAWAYQDTGTYHEFTTNTSILGHTQSTFNITGTWIPVGSGSETVTVQVVDGSGGETRFINNSDSERIDYSGPVPDLAAVITVTPAIFRPGTAFSLTMRVANLGAAATSGQITVTIPKDVLWTLDGSSLTNAAWAYQDTGTHHQFTTSTTIAASNNSQFTINGSALAGGVSGSTIVITSTVAGGGETRLNNNTDSESITYFTS